VMVSNHVIERGQKLAKKLGVTLEEHLGTGNFGIVYRGVDSSGRLVAVKFVEKTQFVKYLEREVNIQCSLKHENLVRLYQFVDDPIMVVMVMEYCDCTLTEYIHKCKGNRIPEPQFRAFARQLMAGLQALHAAGIAHRDLKPDNVLMRRGSTGEYTLKLADFGFAKEEASLLRTQLGSPIYTAPEVSSGRYDAECDLWSIGVVMYEMLVGQRLFLVRTKAELDREIHGPTQCYSLPLDFKASKHCRSFLEGLLVKDPHKRFTFEQAFTHPFVMPKLVLYHFGRPNQMELPIVDVSIELGDVEPSAGDKVLWRDVVKSTLAENQDLFDTTSAEDVVILTQNGVMREIDEAINTDTLKNGFHDILAFCLPTHNTIPKVLETPVGPLDWNKYFPNEAKRQALEAKLHSTSGNSVEWMNVRFEEIQMLLSACNQCALQINKYACYQQNLCQMNAMFFSEWKPMIETILSLQRSVSGKFNEYAKRSSAGASLSMQTVTIIPNRHPDIPTISTFVQQSPEVSRLILEGKNLRNDTQDLYDKGTRNFMNEARRALRILDAAKAHLEQFYEKLTTVLSHVNKEWNYTAKQGVLFSHMVMYIREMRGLDTVLSNPAAATANPTTDEELGRSVVKLKTIACDCPHFHVVSRPTPKPTVPPLAPARPLRTRSGASDLASENSALKLQNESLRAELDEAKKEIARLNAIILSLKR